MPCDQYNLRSLKTSDEIKEFWKTLIHSQKSGYFIGCEINKKGTSEEKKYIDKLLCTQHCYYIIKVKQISNGNKLLKIRNPYLSYF
jgi:hypothetical protein